METIEDPNEKSQTEFWRWKVDYLTCHKKPPSKPEELEYIHTIYHWQTMNTLIHDFNLQKYNGEYIFNYSSWNHDIPVTYVFHENDFRKYLRLMWDNKIPVLKGDYK